VGLKREWTQGEDRSHFPISERKSQSLLGSIKNFSSPKEAKFMVLCSGSLWGGGSDKKEVSEFRNTKKIIRKKKLGENTETFRVYIMKLGHPAPPLRNSICSPRRLKRKGGLKPSKGLRGGKRVQGHVGKNSHGRKETKGACKQPGHPPL